MSKFEDRYRIPSKEEAIRMDESRKEQERMKMEKYNRLLAFAQSIGGRDWFEGRGEEPHLGIKNWTDATDFVKFCNENNVPAKLVAPPKNTKGFEDYFRIYAE